MAEATFAWVTRRRGTNVVDVYRAVPCIVIDRNADSVDDARRGRPRTLPAVLFPAIHRSVRRHSRRLLHLRVTA